MHRDVRCFVSSNSSSSVLAIVCIETTCGGSSVVLYANRSVDSHCKSLCVSSYCNITVNMFDTLLLLRTIHHSTKEPTQVLNRSPDNSYFSLDSQQCNCMCSMHTVSFLVTEDRQLQLRVYRGGHTFTRNTLPRYLDNCCGMGRVQR